MNTPVVSLSEWKMQMAKYQWECVVGPGMSFCREHRPNWFHRLFQRLLLGWEWRRTKWVKTDKYGVDGEPYELPQP